MDSHPKKITPPNCTINACGRRKNCLPDRKGPECTYCPNDKAEIARRKALPLVKGPDGLWRKYLGIREEGDDNDES